jgi:hypothetical protein
MVAVPYNFVPELHRCTEPYAVSTYIVPGTETTKGGLTLVFSRVRTNRRLVPCIFGWSEGTPTAYRFIRGHPAEHFLPHLGYLAPCSRTKDR